MDKIQFAGKTVTLHDLKLISTLFLFSAQKNAADALGIAHSTYRNELQLLYLKFNLHSKAELMLLALQHGFDLEGRYRNDELLV